MSFTKSCSAQYKSFMKEEELWTKRFVLTLLSLCLRKWCQFCVPVHMSVSKFWFPFQFPFHPPGVRGHKPGINLEPDTLSSWATFPASYWSMTDNTGFWLADKISSLVPWVLRVMLMVSPPCSGILQSLAQPAATVFKTIWRMLTDKKFLDFLIFHGTEESSLAQLNHF